MEVIFKVFPEPSWNEDEKGNIKEVAVSLVKRKGISLGSFLFIGHSMYSFHSLVPFPYNTFFNVKVGT